MSLRDFAEAQKTHYTVRPKVRKRNVAQTSNSLPFVKLLNGLETVDMVHKRWELYHQLHSQFHSQVEEIVQGIERDLHMEISRIISKEPSKKTARAFNCLFLLGSDSTTSIDLPKDDTSNTNILIDLTPKESPNVRMMLRRSMFRILTTSEFQSMDSSSRTENEVDENADQPDWEDKPSIESLGLSYDLSLVQNFYLIFQRRLKLVFNFKDVDSFNFQVLDDFIVLLKSALKYEGIEICLVFNINTNLSNIEKNLRQSTIRLLKRNFNKIDLSHNKGFKYANRVFRSFLNTVEGKLNLSSGFVKFILDRMANNATHNLQLLTKMLDFSLMSYFFQNPFSVFIDPTNVVYFSENYLAPLVKCPTFMNFIEGMVREHAPAEEILSLLDNRHSALEEFFTEFLVRENPINGHLQTVIEILENQVDVHNYNIIDLYYHMLNGNLGEFLSRWPKCQKFEGILKFEPVDIIFQELFTLDNSKDLFSQSLFPFLRTNLEDNLINSERILPQPDSDSRQNHTCELALGKLIAPPICHLFNLYREASSLINVHDFYTAFRESLPKDEILKCLVNASALGEIKLELKQEGKFCEFLKGEDSDLLMEKISLVWFIQAISEFQHLGFLKSHNNKSYEVLEKCIWRGL